MACPWDNLYSPHTHKLVDDFYEPVLLNTIRYDRVAGYFRSSVLATVSCGYEGFCDHPDSKMRLIIGLEMTQDDHDRILFWNNPEKVNEEIRRNIEEELTKEGMPSFEKSRLAGLSWMLDNDKLEIKFGVMLDSTTKEWIPWEWGKFHHKICYFRDEQKPENSAMISGSINESEAAWSRNGDSFTPLVSWEPGRSKNTVKDTENLFDALWKTEGKNEDLNVAIYHLPDIPELWKHIVPPIQPDKTTPWPDPGGGGSGPSIEEEDEWEHKITARELFLGDRDSSLSSAPMPAGKQGILCMATGTGKTRTALKIVKEMIGKDLIDKVIITTHKSDLLDQWWTEMANPKRGLTELLPTRFRHYKGKYKQMDKFTLGVSRFKSLLIGRTGLQELLNTSSDDELERTLLIVDECHNFRGEKHREEMVGKYGRISYRLGLSATPKNEYDDDATNFLYEEIGPIFFNYELIDAIKDEVLCPFEYTPIYYDPLQAEKEKAHRIWKRIEAKRKENPRANCEEEYRQISDVYKNSEGKLPVLEKLLRDPSILDRCIIFGPKKEFNSKTKGMLGKTKVRWTPYYGETNQKQLDLYRNNSVDVLLTCKAVSEGMDLHVNNIILLSSDRTKLVTLQRLGRALRTHGDVTKVAKVYDFIRNSDNETADSDRRDWLEGLSKDGLDARRKKKVK